MAKEIKEPGPDHPITIEPATEHVVVELGDSVVADTTSALTLREADYPPVYYVPLADVDEAQLRRTDTATYCPYKGDASYYSVVTPGGDEAVDAVWEYREPRPSVAQIAGHVAFYPNRVRITAT
jgi:uncharacterized protein (DUF427 family)